MIKYTFIFEYKGVTYIEQVQASDLGVAVNIRANLVGTEIPKFGIKKKSQLLKETQLYDPTPIIGIENVWYLYLEINKIFGHLNIVATL
jgi:hypothetical protein